MGWISIKWSRRRFSRRAGMRLNRTLGVQVVCRIKGLYFVLPFSFGRTAGIALALSACKRMGVRYVGVFWWSWA